MNFIEVSKDLVPLPWWNSYTLPMNAYLIILGVCLLIMFIGYVVQND